MAPPEVYTSVILVNQCDIRHRILSALLHDSVSYPSIDELKSANILAENLILWHPQLDTDDVLFIDLAKKYKRIFIITNKLQTQTQTQDDGPIRIDELDIFKWLNIRGNKLAARQLWESALLKTYGNDVDVVTDVTSDNAECLLLSIDNDDMVKTIHKTLSTMHALDLITEYRIKGECMRSFIQCMLKNAVINGNVCYMWNIVDYRKLIYKWVFAKKIATSVIFCDMKVPINTDNFPLESLPSPRSQPDPSDSTPQTE
jgi:hypothetical protein